MKTLALTTAIAIGFAASAQANTQLERSLGVEPGVYSLNELVQLQTAMEENDQNRIRLILNGGGDVVSTQSFGVSAGHAQLAAKLGINPEEYSLAEIIALNTAIEENDRQRARFLQSSGDEVVSTQSFGVTPGQRQLALSLGVEPSQYSLAELAAMKADRYDDN